MFLKILDIHLIVAGGGGGSGHGLGPNSIESDEYKYDNQGDLEYYL